jgi:hypothetical protein
MYIQMKVRYIDGSEGMVDTPRLEELIESGEISHFRRSDGWVDVIGAKTRSAAREKPAYTERRRDFLARQGVFGASATVVRKPLHAPQAVKLSHYWTAIYRTITSFLW